MKVLVFSDSHGNTENMRRAVEEQRPDCLIHLGDCVRDARLLASQFPALPMHLVRGNCDYGCASVPESLELELEGVRLFLAHGDRYRVKLGLDSFCNAAHFSGAALGLFGHTHRALWKPFGAMQVLNPGAVGDPLRPTYGLVEITDGAAVCRIVELINKES